MDALFMLAPQAAWRSGSSTASALSRTASGIMATMPRASTNWKRPSNAPRRRELLVARRLRDHGDHAARFDELEAGFQRVMLARARHGPSGVIELARVLQH